MKDRSPEEWQAAADILQRAVEAGDRDDFEGFQRHFDSLPQWAREYIFSTERGRQLVPLALSAMKDLDPEKLFDILKAHPHLQHCFPKDDPPEEGE